MKTLMVCYACKIKTDSRVPALDEQKEVYGASKAADHCLFQVKTLYADKEEKTADYLYNCLWVYLRTQRVNGQIYVCVCVCYFNLQLYCARGVLEQSDSLRVAHAFSGGSTDTDNAVPDLKE